MCTSPRKRSRAKKRKQKAEEEAEGHAIELHTGGLPTS
jgi:hypothetical protein